MTNLNKYRLIPSLFLVMHCFSQLPQVPVPNFNHSFPSSSPIQGARNITINNDRTVIRESNIEAMKRTGNYIPTTIPPTDPIARHDFILRQSDHQQSNREGEILTILQEAHENERNNHPGVYYGKEFKELVDSYTNAFQVLKGMLSQPSTLSLKDAYYTIESAYGSPYLTKQEFDWQIRNSAEFIKLWLVQNGYNLHNSDHLHTGIQQFMKAELTITRKKPDSDEPPVTVKHLPFFYDYEDFNGVKDFRNYFVTKAFASGGGQCSSLPIVYLVLAEALGVKAWMAFAPQHSFIKYKRRDGNIYNYEPTSGWHISDQWYIENMGINREAIVSKIYFDTLTSKQIVANGMIDLSFGYLQKFGIGDANFVLNCLETAQEYFPKKNNIYYYFMRSEIISRMLAHTIAFHQISVDQIGAYPDARQLHDALLLNEDVIRSLGYVSMNESLYQKLMEAHEFKSKLQQRENISGKEKQNLFIESP